MVGEKSSFLRVVNSTWRGGYMKNLVIFVFVTVFSSMASAQEVEKDKTAQQPTIVRITTVVHGDKAIKQDVVVDTVTKKGVSMSTAPVELPSAAPAGFGDKNVVVQQEVLLTGTTIQALVINSVVNVVIASQAVASPSIIINNSSLGLGDVFSSLKDSGRKAYAKLKTKLGFETDSSKCEEFVPDEQRDDEVILSSSAIQEEVEEEVFIPTGPEAEIIGKLFQSSKGRWFVVESASAAFAINDLSSEDLGAMGFPQATEVEKRSITLPVMNPSTTVAEQMPIKPVHKKARRRIAKGGVGLNPEDRTVYIHNKSTSCVLSVYGLKDGKIEWLWDLESERLVAISYAKYDHVVLKAKAATKGVFGKTLYEAKPEDFKEGSWYWYFTDEKGMIRTKDLSKLPAMKKASKTPVGS